MKIQTILGLGLVVAFLVSCSDSLSGRYVNEENRTEYLEFRSNGTYTAKTEALSFGARYELDGTRLVLRGMGGRAFLAEVEGDSIRIVDEESGFPGKHWIKR